MKIFKHPVHLMLIHFPTALLPMDLVLSFLLYYTGNSDFGPAAFYCMIGGVGTGVLALVTGFIDLAMIRNNRTALNAAFVHGGVNATVLLVYSVFAYKSWNLYPIIQAPTVLVLVVKLTLILFLIVGNFLGGRLILKHHIAIEP